MKIFSLLISNLIYLSHWILMFQLLQETACFFPWWMGARVQSSSELVLHNHLLMNQIFWPTITKLSEHTRIFVYQGTRLARDESQTINNNATIIADWIYIYHIMRCPKPYLLFKWTFLYCLSNHQTNSQFYGNFGRDRQ